MNIDLHPLGRFLADNPTVASTVVAALIAAIVSIALQRRLFSNRATLDRNDRIRELLGAFVAAVHTRQAARDTVANRDAAVYSMLTGDPMVGLKEMMIGQKNKNPELQAARLRATEANEALRQADSQVGSLFFQLSIILRPSENDAIFAAKGLMVADDANSDLYLNGYGLMLGVAGYHFSDGNKEHRKEAKHDIAVFRPLLEADWASHVEERDRDTIEPTSD